MFFLRHAWTGLILLFLSLNTVLAGHYGEKAVVLSKSDLLPINSIVEAEVRSGRIPGAVILIGTREKVLYREAFGHRTFRPFPVPMTTDIIFDLASVTKVVATTLAIMQLMERGELNLEDSVARYWPEFGANGKELITVHDLLTHYSGLRAGLDLSQEWSGYDTAMNMIIAEKPLTRAGERFLYSDVNFQVLGELVRRISGMSLDAYCHENIFGPLNMKDTGYLPDPGLLDRIAPSQDLPGRVHWGGVHDATARWMGGVSGHAGLFSTADDLTIYVRMLLNGGIEDGVRILSEQSVRQMITPQSPADGTRERGLGWDIGYPDDNSIFPAGSYGHLGFTGTMIWIDPDPGIYAIVLTNRTYPVGTGDVRPLRQAILELLGNIAGHPIQATGDDRL